MTRFCEVDAGICAGVVHSPTLRRLLETLPTLQHDQHRPEDVRKVDADDEGIGGG